jgi:hypothetical protein
MEPIEVAFAIENLEDVQMETNQDLGQSCPSAESISQEAVGNLGDNKKRLSHCLK